MARFRATIQGQRGAASRLGSSKSGISARINGWDAGLRIEARAGSKIAEADEFLVYVTGGSNLHHKEKLIAIVRDTVSGPGVEIFNA